MNFRYRVVDVFSARPLAGNALCVVLDPVPDAVMQAIAREVNLSETTFPVVTGAAAYDVRIFTPGNELPFAGHPSLGTAWVLGAQRWTQTSPGATVTIDADEGAAVMTQPDPEFAEIDPSPVASALGLPGADGAVRANVGGMSFTIVATKAPIDRLEPKGVSAAIVRRVDDHNLHVRVFNPAPGIPEDPGTGSAAGPIALFARQLWGTAEDVVIRQGDEVGRPCRIEAHAEVGGMRVGGPVSACAEGTFTL